MSKKIEKWDRPSCRMISDRARALLLPLEQEFGVKLIAGGGTYQDLDFKMKVSFQVNDPGKREEKAKQEFEMYACLFGLEPEDYGKSFCHTGYDFTIVGLNTRKRKFPIICRRADGKIFNYPEESIRLLLGRRRVPLAG